MSERTLERTARAAHGMSRRLALAATTITMALGSFVQAALAHEYWIAPSRWSTADRAKITVGAVAGTGFRGDRKRYPGPLVVRFGAQVNEWLDFTQYARNAEVDWVETSGDDGGAMLAYQSKFTDITLEPAEFDTYLAEEGLDAPLAARRAAGTPTPGRERYRRCAKAWLSGTQARRAKDAVGLPMEIVPRQVPGSGSTLTVRVTFEKKPLAGALVKAWRTDLGAGDASRDPATRDSVGVLWQGRTDRRGEVTVPAITTGEWLLACVHMVPSRDPSADWESTWASLTFARIEP